ncbi:zinc ribbon domain-containing protein [Limnoraphis robusta]|uniref:Zinc ribbon domain-containing protein n=1 Tax=Limnoraphis robusta CCNP1315 TaxID=3110306 RepID=A0ABU5TRD6_9CYAN|nr:zinc ribbon domain-containing protein [Limnoraphis robusta]MEA5498508.1 zinc ribbon domain-containing protein [Limnoraphis robusta BA-68 BA1]MEA5517477.1 zinc ribbon domain-containing protein [Limnoraphis robusta CCNP1315]MEA5548951.1 zinc ribbon domain-containing protein [Limnoraphis robusta CCNP1324]
MVQHGTICKITEYIYATSLCKNCGVSIDRDLNASLNLERFAEGYSV